MLRLGMRTMGVTLKKSKGKKKIEQIEGGSYQQQQQSQGNHGNRVILGGVTNMMTRFKSL